MENTSGGGRNAVVPPEIDNWNWGAFLLTWIWGLGNNTFIAFLMFVPFVNIPMWFILGVKGSAWAWRNKRWESVEAFKRTQRKWAMWGPAVVVFFVLFSGGMFWTMATIFKNSDAYKLALNAVQVNPEATRILGAPIKPGFPTGSMQISGPDGRASLAFDVEGPKGKGTVYVMAIEAMGQWRLDEAVFEDEATKHRIDLRAESDPGK